MEVKNGYKLTEIGIIPNDWQIKALGELSNVSSGGTPNRNINSYWGGNIPWITTSQIDFNVIDEAKEFITEEGLNNSAAKEFESGTLLMAMYGQGKTRGKIAILGLKASTNQACAAISLKSGVVKEFVFYNLASRYDEIRNLSNSGSQENLSGELIKKIHIPLPLNIKEQTAIATALSDTDALISSLEKLIAKKRAIKQGAMQELLKPKDRWKEKKLIEVADSKVKWSFIGGPFGSNLKSSDYTSEGIRVIQLQNIGDGIFVNDSEIYTSVEKANELLSNNIYPGDIILSKMGDPVARACIIPDFHPRYLMCSDGIRLCVDKSKYNPYFIYVYINSPTFRSMAENASTGSTRKRIGLTELKSLKIWCPTIEEQNKIGQILMDMDNEIFILESKLSKYRQIKSGMMQNLLTGKIRLV
jgi:type I restriction enzyme S subunit